VRLRVEASIYDSYPTHTTSMQQHPSCFSLSAESCLSGQVSAATADGERASTSHHCTAVLACVQRGFSMSNASAAVARVLCEQRVFAGLVVGSDELWIILGGLDADVLGGLRVCRAWYNTSRFISAWSSVLQISSLSPFEDFTPDDAVRRLFDSSTFSADEANSLDLVLLDMVHLHGVQLVEMVADSRLLDRLGDPLDVALFARDEYYLAVRFRRCVAVLSFEGRALQCCWLPPGCTSLSMRVAPGHTHIYVRLTDFFGERVGIIGWASI
jgi:hypothetical protein